MSLMKALERHVPSAKLILQETGSFPVYSVKNSDVLWNQLGSVEFLCVYGLSAAFYERARFWLDEEAGRRLVFVEEHAGALSRLLEEDDAILLLNDLRVKIYFLETSLQIEPVAKKVAWQAVFKKISVFLLNQNEKGIQFREELQKCHAASHLLLSDASDWGLSLIQNAKANVAPYRSGMELQGVFEEIPAIIVGAGPSLEKNGSLLRDLENKTLIFAGGSALNVLDAQPHFVASIDKEAPYRQFKMNPFLQIPFCYQSRMNRENFSLVHGEALLLPDGNSAAVNWLQGQEEEFNGGWTVGNFLTAFALLLGCNPIFFVGMDLCYRKGRKYAHLESDTPEGLVEAIDREGKRVWTQRDWLMAARWTEELAFKHPDRVFIDATEGGLGLKPPVHTHSLIDAIDQYTKKEWDLRGKVHSAIQSLPTHSPSNRWETWNQSLQRCAKICENISAFQIEFIEEEVVYQKLLSPLWHVWKSIFERELELDPQQLSLPEKMRLNQILFFQQVLQEHLNG